VTYLTGCDNVRPSYEGGDNRQGIQRHAEHVRGSLAVFAAEKDYRDALTHELKQSLNDDKYRDKLGQRYKT
jgi:hypothetical protein